MATSNMAHRQPGCDPLRRILAPHADPSDTHEQAQARRRAQVQENLDLVAEYTAEAELPDALLAGQQRAYLASLADVHRSRAKRLMDLLLVEAH